MAEGRIAMLVSSMTGFNMVGYVSSLIPSRWGTLEQKRFLIRIPLSFVEFACTREEVSSVFMKGNRHNTIRMPECKFDTIAMMNVNVNIEYSRMISA